MDNVKYIECMKNLIGLWNLWSNQTKTHFCQREPVTHWEHDKIGLHNSNANHSQEL